MIRLVPGTSAAVRVPATSANLGPGFDTLGLALAWYDDVRIEVTAGGLTIDVTGHGAETAPRDESHLIICTVRTTLAELGAEAAGLHLRSTNRIPHGRGLGSSAAAICAGVLLARALVARSSGSGLTGSQSPGSRFTGSQSTDSQSTGSQSDVSLVIDQSDENDIMDADAVLTRSSRIEGHPDNVAACLLGGLTIAWTVAGPGSVPTAHAVSLAPLERLRPVILVPTSQSSTEQSRRLLPANVPHVDAAFNAARAALLVAALTAQPDVLLAATEDRLHQPYRAPAMPASAELVERLRAAGLPAVISGAGPTVIVLSTSDAIAAAAVALAPRGWRAEVVDVDRDGAQVTVDRSG